MRDRGFRSAVTLVGFIVGLLFFYVLFQVLAGHGLQPHLLLPALAIAVILGAVVTLRAYLIGTKMGSRYLVGDRTEVADPPFA